MPLLTKTTQMARFSQKIADVVAARSKIAGVLSKALVPLLLAFLAVWIALATIPMPPDALGTGLDPSWGYALNLAHAQNLIFGRDVVFTYGPLGYLIAPDPELTKPIPVLACSWAVYGMFLFGMFLTWRSLGHRLIVSVSWIVFLVAMLLVPAPFERMQISFLSVAIGIAASLTVEREVNITPFCVAGVVAGLMPLFKSNEGIAACAVYYGLIATLFLRRPAKARELWRSAATLAFLPPLSFAFAYALVERNILHIWAYAAGSFQMVTGYSEAMAMPGHLYQCVLGVFGILGLWFVVPIVAERPECLVKGYLPAALAGFLAFKSGVVRQDDFHADFLQIKLAVAAVFLLVCAKTRRDQRLLTSLVLAGICFGASESQGVFPSQFQLAVDRGTLRDLAAIAAANWRFSSTWDQLSRRTHQNLDRNRVDRTVSDAVSGGTVDVVPNEVDLVVANGWRWSPRPVFQSYAAYTPFLDTLNARHLGGAASAEHVIMQWDDIDGRQPLLDDASSWRALFDYYDIQLRRPDLLVLRRRESPRYFDPHSIGTAAGRWNSDIAVPRLELNEVAMMRVEIDKSLWGSLRGLLFRNSPVYLSSTSVSGKQQHWRVTRANLVNGAFIGYLPEKLSETLSYFGEFGASVPDGVASVRFETPGSTEFSPEIRISWYSVVFRQGEAHFVSEPQLTTSTIWKPGQPVSAFRATTEFRADELIVRPTQFDPNLTFVFPQSLGSYQTLIVRARFSRTGRINAFFGRQSEGRGIEGYVPEVNQWINIYLNLAGNPFWGAEAGNTLRFDPPDESVGSTIEIAGIWASTSRLPQTDQMLFYRVQSREPGPTAPSVLVAQTGSPAEPQSRVLDGGTVAYVDGVDGRPHSGESINAKVDSLLTVSGWAIDAPGKKLASAVFVDIDGQLFPAAYGLVRSDVAAALKDSRYEKSGFSSQIRLKTVGPGSHKVSIRIVNSSRTGYYGGPSFSLNVQ